MERNNNSVFVLPLLRTFEHTISAQSGDKSFPSSDLRRIFGRIKKIAKEMSQTDIPVCLMWEWQKQGESGSKYLWEDNILINIIASRTKSDLYSVSVDKSGKILGDCSYEMDESVLRDSVFASHVSFSFPDAVVFYFYAAELFVFFRGMQCEHVPNVFMESSLRGTRSKYSDEAANYSKMIQEHFNDYIEEEQATSHWQNRSRRILRPAPEAIFRNSLWKFLDDYVVDAIRVVKEEVISGSTSKVDIVIETTNSSYLIEVKWLGVASKGGTSGTSNGVMRARAGARQVIRYITLSRGRATKGILVMYDARHANEEIPWESEESHPLLDKSLRLWLRSDSASQA